MAEIWLKRNQDSRGPGWYVGYPPLTPVEDYLTTNDPNEVALWVLRGWTVWLEVEKKTGLGGSRWNIISRSY